MTTNELHALVLTAGLSCRVRGGEVVLQVCLFCGNDRNNLELNAAEGLYHCWACRAGGRLDNLLNKITGHSYNLPVAPRGPRKKDAPLPPDALDFQTLAIADVPSAAHYLSRRGITPDVAAAYGLRFCSHAGHRLENRIVVPARDFWSREQLGWIGRSYTGALPKYLTTLAAKRVIGMRQSGRSVPCVLVEGPFDGIAVHRAGYNAAILSGISSPDVVDFAARLEPTMPLIIMLDAEAVVEATLLYWQVLPVHERTFYSQLIGDQDPASIGPDGIQRTVSQFIQSGRPDL